MKKRLIYLLIIFSCLVICTFLFWATSATYNEIESSRLKIYNQNQPAKINDSIYRIITYNLGHLNGFRTNTSKHDFENNRERVSELLKSYNAAIIAMQDVDFDSKRSFHINQSEEIAKIGFSYVNESYNWDKKYLPISIWPPKDHIGKIIAGQAILSIYPIVEHQRIVLESNTNYSVLKKKISLKRIAQLAKININEKTIIIINTHLEDANKETRDEQIEQLIDLFKKFSGNHSVILLGDFNSSINKPNSSIMKIFELENVGYSNYKNLDHIFFTKESIEIFHSQVLTEFSSVSSHLPVLMEFKLK